MSSEESETETIRQQAPPSVIRDMGITVLFILLSVGFLIISGRFAGERISEFDPGVAFWPRAVLVVILVSGILNLVLLYRRASRNDESLSPSFDLEGVGLGEKQRMYVVAIVLSVVFFLSLEYIGFLVASPFFLFAFAYAIGYDDFGKLTVFSVVTALAIFFAFRNVMSIALPYGTGVFREISVYAANLF